MHELLTSAFVLAPLVAVSLAPPARSQTDADAQTEAPTEPKATGPRYRESTQAEKLFAGWMGSGLAEKLELGVSAGGRELFGIQFGAGGATPLAERTTFLLLGGLDGVSIAGSEAVLTVTEHLLLRPDALPSDVTFIAIPWANPDGLARWYATGCGGGRNDRAIDDDGDGAIDEDGPDDMDSDGLVLELLIEDENGTVAKADDGRFLRPAREGDMRRYLHMTEGRDDDGDGRYNEDPPGGVVLDHNFPVNWQGAWSGFPAGSWPLSEPCARAIADLAMARKTAVALVFQGSHGGLATPGGSRVPGALELPFDGDRVLFERLARRFSEVTGRARAEAAPTLYDARGGEYPGAAIDWLYASLGAIALEVGIWGPTIHVRSRTAGRPEADEASALAMSGPGLGVFSADWARWLDDTRGGMGFVDWQPVNLGKGEFGYVGGWMPRTCFNPPEEILGAALGGLGEYVLALAKELARPEIDLLEVARDGRVVSLRARVQNPTALALGVGPRSAQRGVGLALELPESARLVAGQPETRWSFLAGRGVSPEVHWVFVLPEGETVHLRLTAPERVPRRLEVRP